MKTKVRTRDKRLTRPVWKRLVYWICPECGWPRSSKYPAICGICKKPMVRW